MTDNHSPLKFPCQFPIKVMGKKSPNFEAVVLGIVRKHAPDLGEAAVNLQYSRKQNYVSLTVTVNARSQAQLDAIYQALTDEDAILMVL